MSSIQHCLGIHNNKTAELTTLLFEHCYTYVCNQAEKLYQQTLKAQGKEDECYGIYIGNTLFYRPKDVLNFHHKKVITLDDSLRDQGDELESFFLQVKKDIRFIQMWLSLVIDATDAVSTRAKLPTILANIHPLYKVTAFREPYIPKGKEQLWKQAENKISFYLGLKFVL